MTKRENKYAGNESSFQYRMGGIVHETAFTQNLESLGNFGSREDLQRVNEKLAFLDQILFSTHSGVNIGLKNGNAFTDGGISIPLGDHVEIFSCYPIHVDKFHRIVDDNEYLNGKNIFDFIAELRPLNPKLRLDGSMTSGWIESFAMEQLITELNTRNSYLDVWEHCI